MSRLFNTVKRYYEKGYYSDEDVAKFVKAGKITQEEYEAIVGERYTEIVELINS